MARVPRWATYPARGPAGATPPSRREERLPVMPRRDPGDVSPLSDEELNALDQDLDRRVFHSLTAFSPRFALLFFVLAGVVGALFLSWAAQVVLGIGISGKRRPSFWGFYITSFVFWIGISHSGTLVSAILRVLNVEWRRPLTRAAEAMTVFALMVGGLFPLIHLGRLWKFYWMMPYPNERNLWPNFHSAILWDLLAILTYLTTSLLFLFVPMIPDLAAARDHTTGIRRRIYGALSLGWRGSQQQWHRLHVAMKILTVIVIPVAVSVHSIVSWDFAMTVQEYWNSTIFAPYFVLGAIYSGVAALITVLIILRRTMGLEHHLTVRHLDRMGKVLLAVAVIWFYLFFAHSLTLWYSGNPVEHEIERLHLVGSYAPFFWTMVFVNVILPFFTLWFRRVRTSMAAMLVISILINVGMWLERMLIVVGSNTRNHLPYSWGGFEPGWPEVVIAVATFGMFAFLYVLFSKAFPMISLWEVKEGWRLDRWERTGLLDNPSDIPQLPAEEPR
jgi:Ni/Fe-hydrogenase subunit HybB-like protein